MSTATSTHESSKSVFTSQEDSKIVEIEDHNPINSVAFLRDNKRIVGGGDEAALRYWEVKGGRQVAAAACGDGVLTVAVSKDGQRVVCGTKSGLVSVWDATTHEKVVEIKAHTYWVAAVDVSPDSRTVGTASYDRTSSIWDITTGQLLVVLRKSSGTALVAIKFSTDGSRVATSPYAQDSVWIHDTESGRLLVDVPVRLSSNGNEPTVPLAWSNDDQQLFTVSSGGTIQCFDTSSGSLLSKWSIHSSVQPASIALSNNGKFIVASADSSISFWDTSSHSQLGPVVTHPGSVQSIAISSDDKRLVSGGRTGRKIVVWDLQSILPESHRLESASKFAVALLQHLNGPVCELWMHDDWKKAEMVLTDEFSHLSHPDHHLSANRALIRGCLQDWSGALDDACQSLEVQPSVIGYIAKAIAHIGQGESQAGIRIFDLAFMYCSPEETAFLLLIRSIILFRTGEREDAMARVQNLIDTVDDKSIFYTVQAQMLVLLGNMFIEEDDYDGAIKVLKLAQPQSPPPASPHLQTISLLFGWKFSGLALSVRRQLCEALHATGRMKEAADALRETLNTLNENVRTSEEGDKWISEFTNRCVATFESMGDAAIHSHAHDEAIEKYSVALTLSPTAQSLYLKRSKARAIMGLWEEAISDANEAIALDPSCPWGYEGKHAALHGAQRFEEAVDAFVLMLSAIEKSLDEGIRQRRKNYVSPSVTTAAIDVAIQETFKTCPFVLIDTKTGLLCDVPERTRIFKADPTFKELVSSMTEELDENYILQVVSGYFRYVMFSHTWEGKEPSFHEVNVVKSVWVLPPSQLNDKLRKFCEVVRDDGYRWAWSDTCCINKSTSMLLSQSVVSMYQWYEEAAATLALLASVPSPSQPGDLTSSLWMTRSWTLLELLASKVIRFFDSEWKPYLNDARTNHKDSPAIVQELANALEVAPEVITNFAPGALGVREVLRLASTRAATIEEDVAYSLIGIFGSDLTPNYGEGEAALGHLLEEILTRSGELSVLAWAGGISSGYNSCLPASISVYKQPLFMSPAMSEDKIEARVATLRTTLAQLEAMTIYDRITRLPPVIGAHRRLHLPCIVSPIKKVRRHQNDTYQAKTSTLGEVEFRTTDVIPHAEPRKLCFVHPWIHGLVDQTETPGRPTWEDDSETDIDTDSDVDFNSALDIEPSIAGTTPLIVGAESIRSRLSPLPSLSSIASQLTRIDEYTRALRLVARLERPFSAFLFQQTSSGKFRRVATEHEIIVHPREITCAKDVQTAVLEVL